MKTTALSTSTATLCTGQVIHARTPRSGDSFGVREATVANAFRYPLAFVAIPLRGADSARPCEEISRGGWFAVDGRAVMQIASRDHGARDGSPLLDWAADVLRREGMTFADGEVVLQTFPRLFGALFNPVSFYFCHDRAGELRAVIAEVNNTFGEHHNYLIAHPDQRPISAADRLPARKVFHVSPFFPVAGEYRFRFDLQPTRRRVEIDYFLHGERALFTAVEGECQPLDQRAARRAALKFPLLAVGVVWRIHWQALRLWLKGAFFFRKPAPPLSETTR